tara:strand:- start:1965 stop:2669 length:705 start_codon:yes stop_codon:yes gene_type:complete
MNDWTWHYDPITSDSEAEDDDGVFDNVPLWLTLESSNFQNIWKHSAGKRIHQSIQERRYYENIWMKNSQIFKLNGITDGSGNMNEIYKHILTDNSGNNLFITNIENKLKNIYANKYSKIQIRHFDKQGTCGIQISHFKILNNRAYYLIKLYYSNTSNQIWKSYTEIKILYKKFINNNQCIYTKSSWKIVEGRKQLFRNISTDYLIIKTYLLERVIHDIFYECESFTELHSLIYT